MGKSKAAGQAAVQQVAISRVVSAAPALFVPGKLGINTRTNNVTIGKNQFPQAKQVANHSIELAHRNSQHNGCFTMCDCPVSAKGEFGW